MKNKSFPKGFSLMELLVVVMIILLILSIGGNTYRNQRKHVQFTDALLKVSSMISQARDYTITSRSINDTTGCPSPGEEVYIPPNGYGVYVERSDTPGQSRFVLFANTQADDEIKMSKYDEVAGNPCVSDFIEEEYLLPVDVDYVELATDKLGTSNDGNTTDDEVAIIFSPPLADTTITVNDITTDPDDLVFLYDLYMHFRRPDSDPSVPSHFIHINKIGGFPETETSS